MVRFVPNILLLASNTCRPFALAPLVVMLELSRVIVPPNAAAPSALKPDSDKIPEVVIATPFAATVPPIKGENTDAASSCSRDRSVGIYFH